MQIIETSAFTRQVTALLDSETYRLLQIALVADPRSGSVIPGSGGLRKLRWPVPGQGKQGGLRLIYHWVPERAILLLIFLYAKSARDNLTSAQLRALRRLVSEAFE